MNLTEALQNEDRITLKDITHEGNLEKRVMHSVDTIADLSAVPASYKAVFVRGYHEAGDGGGGTFVYDRSKSTVNDTGMVCYGWIRQYVSCVSVLFFGAYRDKTNFRETTDAIQNTIEYVNMVGGGVVLFPRGTYGVTKTSLVRPVLTAGDEDYCLHFYGSNVSYVGQGATLIGTDITPYQKYTIVRAGKLPVINGETSYTNCLIEGLILDGGRMPLDTDTILSENLMWYHGFSDSTVNNCKFFNSAHYGIGIQNGGTKNVLLSNIHIKNTLHDGVDIKNNGSKNYGIKMDNITVDNFGIGNNPSASFAGIDIMSAVSLSNITVRNFGNSNNSTRDAGIRFKQGELTEDRGVGARGSSITNFNIDKGGYTDFKSNGIRSNDRNIAIANGYINNCGQSGIRIIQESCVIDNVIIESCEHGIECANSTYQTNGNDCQFSNIKVINSTNYAIKIGTARNVLTNVQIKNCAKGIEFSSASESNNLVGSVVVATGQKLRNAGTNNHISNTIGLVTQENITKDIVVDTTGTSSHTINHSLGFKPNIEDITLTLIRSANNVGYTVSRLAVVGVSSTVISFTISITVASPMSGDTATVVVSIKPLEIGGIA